MIEQTARPTRGVTADCKRYGEPAERLFLQEFRQYHIEDVRDDPKYRNDDIDFILTKDGKRTAIDVKCDTRALDSGNFLWEMISHGKTGWGDKTKADYLFFVYCYDDPDGLRAFDTYWLNVARFREWLRYHPKEYRSRANVIKGEEICDILIYDALNTFARYPVALGGFFQYHRNLNGLNISKI